MTKVNFFDDLNKPMHFLIKPAADITLTIHALHIRTSTNRIHNRLNQLRMQS